MAAIVERVLAGLDEDLMEYVQGLVEDTEDDEELAEAIAGFCLSSGLIDEDDEAEAKAKELLEALGRGAAAPPAPAPTPPPAPVAAKPTSNAALAAAQATYVAPPAAPVVNAPIADRKPAKEKKPKKAPLRKANPNSVAAKRAQLDEEMEAARVCGGVPGALSFLARVVSEVATTPRPHRLRRDNGASTRVEARPAILQRRL